MTYTRQLLVSHPWNNPIFTHPTCHPYPHPSNRLLKLPIDSALTTCLPSLFQSFTTVSEPISTILIVKKKIPLRIRKYVTYNKAFFTIIYNISALITTSNNS